MRGEPGLAPLREDFSPETATPESTINHHLETARRKSLSHKIEDKKAGLMELWKAWEYMSKLPAHGNVEKAAKRLLDKVAEGSFRTALSKEAKTLGAIWNTSAIRHANLQQSRFEKPEHVDYLYFRLMAFIDLTRRLLWPA